MEIVSHVSTDIDTAPDTNHERGTSLRTREFPRENIHILFLKNATT